MTRSMDPIFRLSAPKTGVPSTLSLPIRLPVSLASVAMWHLPGSVHGYEIEKPTGWKIVPKPGDAIATGNATNRFASGTRHVITQVLMRDEEVATFGYPRERSF